jgi:succinate-acetate transporter protein
MIQRVETEGDVAVTRIAEHEIWRPSGPVVSHLREDDVAMLEEQSIISMGDASALALFGFATGTWMSATVLGGMLDPAAAVAVAPVVLVFAGLAQFIAGLFAFRRANAMAGTAFCCFGAFNVTVAVSFIMQATMVIPAIPGASLLEGFLLVSFGFIALALTLASLRVNLALVAVLATLCVGYTLSGIPHLIQPAGQGATVIGVIGACFLFASAFFAYYTGMALVVNSAWKRTLFPLMPLSWRTDVPSGAMPG